MAKPSCRFEKTRTNLGDYDMANNNDNLFDDLSDTVTVDRVVSPRNRAKTSNYIGSRGNRLSEIVGGEVEEKTFLWVLPERCRLWERHNRQYDLLNELRCKDLIDGFKSQGRQEMPAIVRKVQGDPNYDYEVICGARRHWTVSYLRNNNYTQYKFLIDVRDMSDEESFRMSDIENRDKEDISDYERACDYRNALDYYYEGVQQKMANRLEVSKDWLSRFIYLASFPTQIVNAYADIFDIKVAHVRKLKPLLDDRKLKKHILKRAEELTEEQTSLRKEGEKPLKGVQVVNELITAIKRKSKAKADDNKPLAEYEADGKKILAVMKKGKGKLLFTINTSEGVSKESLLKACSEAIGDFT